MNDPDNEERLRRLVNILQYPAASIQEFLDYALSQSIELTASKFGYIYHYSEEREEFILNTWSKGVMDECRVAEQQKVYALAKTGIWGEAVRQRKPIVLNDFERDNPLKKGYPPGHVPLQNFMTVPVMKENKIVGVIGLANKSSDYTELDVLQTSLLMEAVFAAAETKKAEESLKRVSTRLEMATKSARVGIWSFDYETGMFLLDDMMMSLNGLEGPGGVVELTVMRGIIHPDDIGPAERSLRDAIEGNGEFEMEYRIFWKDGSIHHIRSIGSVMKEPQDPFAKLIGTNWDVTAERVAARKLREEIAERLKIENALRESEEKLRVIIETSPDGVAIAALDGTVEYVTLTCARMWGYESPSELIGRNIMEFLDESYHEKATYYLNEMFKGNMTGAAEYLMVKKDGSKFYIEANANILRDTDGNPTGVLFIERDATEHHRMESEIRELAIHDQLTGLYNRRKIDESLKENGADSAWRGDLSVIMGDIDHFKEVNDTYGHLVGDEVLVAFSRILASETRKTDVLGRWGGEEFIIICPDTELSGACSLAEKLRKKVDEAGFVSVGRKTASFGVAQLRPEESMDSLLTRCDRALYAAKEWGRNRVVTEDEI